MQLPAVWGTVWLLGMTWARLLEAGNPVARSPAVLDGQGSQLCTCPRAGGKASLGHWPLRTITETVPGKPRWLISLQRLHQLSQVQEQTPPRPELPFRPVCLLC